MKQQAAPPIFLDVALVRLSSQGRGEAVCLAAQSSHNYFWDPAGPPAPTPYFTACVPEVSGSEVVRRRMHCVNRIWQKASSAVCSVLVMICALFAIEFDPQFMNCSFVQQHALTSSWSDQHIVANLFTSIQWILSRLLFVHLLHVMLHHTNLLACLTDRKATLPAQCRIVKRRRYRHTRVHIRTNKQWYDLRNKAFSFMFCVLCSSLILHIHNSIKSISSQIGEAKSSQSAL